MTIKEFAKARGITTQAVYARIKAANINLEKIKAKDSAELSPEGLEIVKQLFDKKKGCNEEKTAEYLFKISALQAQNEKLTNSLEEAKKQGEDWRGQAERWAQAAKEAQEMALNAQQTITKLQDALQEAQKTAQQAQAINMATLQRITAPEEKTETEREKRSFWARLTGRK